LDASRRKGGGRGGEVRRWRMRGLARLIGLRWEGLVGMSGGKEEQEDEDKGVEIGTAAMQVELVDKGKEESNED
jgi:hypothetical protein